MKTGISIILLMFVMQSLTARADNFFVDGYHGGIYGHYPVEWKTRFIVDKMNAHPRWRLGLEIEPETWDSVRIRTPRDYDNFVALMKEGRMEYTNPTYAQPYCYNISGESLIRQFSYGIKKLHEHFPDMTFSTYSCEEPCFTSCLPAILKGFGFKYASLKCPDTCWGGYFAPYGGQLVNWEGPDGSLILTVPRYECEDLESGTVWQTTAWKNSPKYLEACRKAGIENPVGMCYQDAGWKNGPWLGKNRGGSQYVLWTDYIENHTPGHTDDTHRFTQDDVRANLMWGSQVMQKIAQQVRRAENSMIMAEKVGAIVWGSTCGAVLPDSEKIDEGWRQLMLAQHHDSWIVPYNGLWNFGTWADAIAQWTDYACGVSTEEIERLAGAINPGEKLMVKVFNTTARDRNEVVEVALPEGFPQDNYGIELTDYRGQRVDNEIKIDKGSKFKRLQFRATVPSMGYSTYSVALVNQPAMANKKVFQEKSSGDGDKVLMLENENYVVVIDLMKGGTVKSLKLKNGSGVEIAPGSDSEFALCELRGFFYDEGRYHSSVEKPAALIARNSGSFDESVTVSGEIAGHPYTLTYTLPQGSRRLDCHVHIDWQGNPGIGEYRETNWRNDRRGFCDDRYKLCLLLPTAFSADRLWKDAPFDSYETTEKSNVFNKWSEIKNNIILNWIDVTDKNNDRGLGLITDHTGSYVHDPDFPTALTLQYSGPGLWGPDYKITGPLDVKFSLVPHGPETGNDVVKEESILYNEPLIAMVSPGSGKPDNGSVLNVNGDGYVLSAALVNADGEATIRFFNSHAGNAATVDINIPEITIAETDLRGIETGQPQINKNKKSSRFKVESPVNGLKTYRVAFKK